MNSVRLNRESLAETAATMSKPIAKNGARFFICLYVFAMLIEIQESIAVRNDDFQKISLWTFDHAGGSLWFDLARNPTDEISFQFRRGSQGCTASTTGSASLHSKLQLLPCAPHTRFELRSYTG